MDPAVSGALIGACAVAVTAISGFVASARVARITSRDASVTVRSALVEQHRQRVWGYRADVYVETFEYVHRRLRARQSRYEPSVLTAEGGTGLMPPIDYGSDEWFAFDARLRAFASDAVLAAFAAALQADIAARDAITKNSPSVAEAMRAAVGADAVLHDAIRAEFAQLAGFAFRVSPASATSSTETNAP